MLAWCHHLVPNSCRGKNIPQSRALQSSCCSPPHHSHRPTPLHCRHLLWGTQGLRLLAGEAAFAEAQRPLGPVLKPYVVAQRYVAAPMLLGGRKFGLRLWVLVSGSDPLRVWMHRRGLVLFSTEG